MKVLYENEETEGLENEGAAADENNRREEQKATSKVAGPAIAVKDNKKKEKVSKSTFKHHQTKVEDSKHGKPETDEQKAQKKREALENKRPTQYRGREKGFTSMKVHAHWGWVTQIKYY